MVSPVAFTIDYLADDLEQLHGRHPPLDRAKRPARTNG
jgi:hypothetical protein